MEFPVDANTLAYWPMNETENSQLSVASLRVALSQTSKDPDFGFTASNVGQDIDVGSTATLRFEQSNAFSISAWIMPLTAQLQSTLISNCAVTTNRGYEFRLTTSGVLQLRLTNTQSAAEFVISHTGAGLVDGLEHHIVVTYDGTHTQAGTKFYVDGVVRTTSAPTINTLSSQTIVSTGSLKIGKNGDNGSPTYYQGSLRHLSMWNTALSAANVTTLFNSGTPGDLSLVSFVANLLAWWKIQAADDYVTAGGIKDYATVGPFNGTSEGGLGTTLSTQLTATSVTRIPKISCGPRQALDLGQDNCRWFSLSSTGLSTTHLRSGITTFQRRGLAQTTKCLLGSAWTIEGWLFIDRDPVALGTTLSVIGYDESGTAITQDLGTIRITASRKIQITWEGPTLRTAVSTLDAPIQQWFHFAIIGTVNGANRDVQFYIAGIDAGLVTGLQKASNTDYSNNSWIIGENPADASTLPFFGGMAYIRVSDVARSLVEISAAAAEPANIINDANTVAFWNFQEAPQIRDKSPYGFHLIQRDLIQGSDPASPFDIYAGQGPATLTPGHYFANTTSNTTMDAPIRQLLADAFCDQNEYTIETFFKAENNTSAHVLFSSGGPTTAGLTATDNNIVSKWTLTSTQKFSIQWQAEERYGWTLETNNPAFTQSGVQSGEFSTWYGFAIRKKAVGLLPYWKEDGVDDAVSMGNAATFSFEFTNSFTIIAWMSSNTLANQHIAGKSESDATPAGYSLFINTSGQIAFRVQGNVGTQRAEKNTNTVFTDGFEHCVGATYNGSGLNTGILIYVDGVSQALATGTSTLASASILNAAPFTLGMRNLADQAHKGYIRQVSVWNRVLTASEMLEAYDMAGAPPNLLSTSMASALIGWWKFDNSDTAINVVDHSISAINGTPQGGLAPTMFNSSSYDFLVNGVLLETVGPLPDPKIGNIYAANTAQYFQSVHNTQTEESRSATRISNVARSDLDILSLYAALTREGTSLEFKMRAVDDARPIPGYIYWITNFPDFQATQVATATPPLLGNVVPGSVIQISSWPV